MPKLSLFKDDHSQALNSLYEKKFQCSESR